MFSQAQLPVGDEYYQSQVLANADPGLSTYLGAITDEALKRNPTPSAFRYFSNSSIEKEGEQVDPETLNKEFGISGRLNFDRPMSREAAKMYRDLKDDEIINQDIIRRGGSGFFRGAAGLVAGFGTTFLDPSNIALALVPGLGEAKVAQALGVGKIASRLIAGGVEGGVTALAAEVPIQMTATQEYADYTMADSALNILFGVGAGSIIRAGAGALGDMLNALPPDERAELTKAILSKASRGENVDIGPIIDVHPRVVVEELRLGRRLSPDERYDVITRKYTEEEFQLARNEIESKLNERIDAKIIADRLSGKIDSPNLKSLYSDVSDYFWKVSDLGQIEKPTKVDLENLIEDVNKISFRIKQNSFLTSSEKLNLLNPIDNLTSKIRISAKKRGWEDLISKIDNEMKVVSDAKIEEVLTRRANQKIKSPEVQAEIQARYKRHFDSIDPQNKNIPKSDVSSPEPKTSGDKLRDNLDIEKEAAILEEQVNDIKQRDSMLHKDVGGESLLKEVDEISSVHAGEVKAWKRGAECFLRSLI